MADNYTAKDASGTTQTFAADDIASVYYPRVKMVWGADGAANDTSAANPLPVVQTGTPTLPTGAATEATLATRLTESDFDTKIGALTEAAPATDTASSGLNGRLQRIAQRITSLIALIPAALTGSGNFKVATVEDTTGAAASLAVMDDWDNGASDGASVSGDVADDAVDAGEPVKVGGKALTAERTAVAANDRVNAVFDTTGRQVVLNEALLEDVVSGNASNTDGASTQCIAAQAAGVKTYLTLIILTNTSATPTYCEIKDGTTVKLTIPVPANGGAVVPLTKPLGGTAATAWNFDPGAATTTMYCSMVGFKSKI